MDSAQSKPTYGYVPGIDGLRAYAVLAVIFYHFRNSLLPGGFCGVDVFFAISGYVVSRSLYGADTATFRHFTLGFYARRILRIYPGLLVCLLATGLLQVLFIPLSWLSTTSFKTALFAFFGASNFALIWFNDGYFSPRVEFNAYTHTWSLAVEEQFYLVYPAIFFIWRVSRPGSGRAAARVLLPLLLVASLIWSAYESHVAADHAYYLLPSRFWELAAGALLFQLHSRGALLPSSQAGRSACLGGGLFLIALGYVYADPHAFPFPWAIAPVLGSLLVMAGAAGLSEAKPQLARLFESAAIVYVGRISYSLYLWHWPVAVLLRWTIGLEGALALGIGLMLTFAAGAASYRFIERPVRQSSYAAAQSDTFIVSRGMAVVGLAAVAGLASFLVQPYISLSVTRDRLNWYHSNSPLQIDWSKLLRHGDGAPVGQESMRASTPRLFVLGDSHAGAYATLEQMLRDEQGMRVDVFMKEACPAAGLLAPTQGACARFVQDSLQQILASAAPGDMVLLASLRSERIGDQWRVIDEFAVAREQAGPEAARRREAAWQEADQIVSRLEQAGLKVIMDAPLPVFKAPPFRCSDWFNAANPICAKGMTIDKQFLQNLRQPVMDSLGRLAMRHPGLVVWDPLPLLCPGTQCSAFDGKVPIFFDCDHLSGHGNRLLYPSFANLLARIRGEPSRSLPDAARLSERP